MYRIDQKGHALVIPADLGELKWTKEQAMALARVGFHVVEETNAPQNRKKQKDNTEQHQNGDQSRQEA